MRTSGLFQSAVGVVAVIIQQHGRRRNNKDFCTFFFHLSSAALLLNYKSNSLGMLTIQSNMTLALLSKKCLTKQCKQQLQLCCFSLPPLSLLLSHSHLLPQMMYSMLHWAIHMERLEDFRLKLIFLPLGSRKSQKLLHVHLWNRFSLLTLKAIW